MGRTSVQPPRAEQASPRRKREIEVRRRIFVLDTPTLRPLADMHSPYVAQFGGWDDLIRTVALAPPSSVVVVDPFVGGLPDIELDSRVKRLLAATRVVPIVAVVPFEPAYVAHARTLLEWGATDVADALLESTAEAMRFRLLAVHAQPLKRAVEPHLSRFVTGNALTMIRAAAEVVVDGGTLKGLGEIFDSSERTVAGWCAREALPPPRRLLAWMRLLLALTLLQEPHRSVVNAATCSGYLDYSLRRAVRLFLGDGGVIRGRKLEYAMEVFNDELRMLREKARADQRSRREAVR